MGGVNEEVKEEPKLTTDPDLLVDFQGVSFVRDGKTLVGPVDWQVELDERWVVVGPNGGEDHADSHGCRSGIPL